MELNIVTFNSASLVSHAQRATAQALVDTLKADIFCVSETHLNHRHNVNFTGYTTIRHNSNTGAALLVKKDYHFEEVVIEGLLVCSAAAAIVKTIDNKRILVVSVYFKYNSPSEQLGHDLKVLGDLQLKSKYLIFGGDFNSRHKSWGDKAENLNGKTLYNWIHDPFTPANLEVVSPYSPTRPASQSIIDFFLLSDETKQSFQVTSCKTLPGMSDHFAVELKMASTSQLQKRVKITIRSFAHTDWDKFKSDLAPRLNLKKLATDRNLSDKEIDEAIILATDAINTATRRNTRLIKVDEFVYNKLPHDIMLHMKVTQIWRRNLKRNFYKYGNKVNAEYKALLSRINCLSTIIREMVAQFRNKELTRNLADIKPGPDMFQHINRLAGKNKSRNFVLTRNKEPICGDARKAQVLAESFESQLNTPPPQSNPAIVSMVETTIADFVSRHSNRLVTFSQTNSLVKPTDSQQFLSLSQLTALTSNLNGKKSAGPDEIPNYVIRQLPRVSIKFLLAVFNNCINNGYFPTTGKQP